MKSNHTVYCSESFNRVFRRFGQMVLRCAIVGLTGIGTRHALGLLGDERVTLVAGCDDGFAENAQLSEDGASQATAEQVGAAFKANYAKAYPDLRIYSSHKEMLAAEGQLDIVTVGVSDHRHADIVVDAANAGVKGIFCEKPLATTMADTDRMVEACERNGTVLSVDHTRRFLPIWRYCKEQLVDKGAIGEVQYIISRLHGPRSMMWRNGTHNIDVMLWFANAKPSFVVGDFEPGYEEYDSYGQRGMDGGKDPALEPAVNGYIGFENGVKVSSSAARRRHRRRSRWRWRLWVRREGSWLIMQAMGATRLESGRALTKHRLRSGGGTAVRWRQSCRVMSISHASHRHKEARLLVDGARSRWIPTVQAMMHL